MPNRAATVRCSLGQISAICLSSEGAPLTAKAQMAVKAPPALAAIRPEGFVKTDPVPERLQVESRKALAASTVADAGTLFRVPHLLELSENRSVSTPVFGLSSMRCVLHEMGNSVERKVLLAGRIGRILATIHRDLDLPLAPGTSLPPPYAEPDIVAIHGDFCLGNIQIKSETDQIYIVDWSTPAWCGHWCSHGSSAWDVGVFLCSLFYQRPGDPMWISHGAAIQRAFLRGYQEIRSFELARHRSQILQVARTFFLAERGYSRPYLRLPSLARLVLVK